MVFMEHSFLEPALDICCSIKKRWIPRHQLKITHIYYSFHNLYELGIQSWPAGSSDLGHVTRVWLRFLERAGVGALIWKYKWRIVYFQGRFHGLSEEFNSLRFVKQKASVSAGFWSLFNRPACFIKASKRNGEIIHHKPLQFNDEKTVPSVLTCSS